MGLVRVKGRKIATKARCLHDAALGYLAALVQSF